MRTLRNVVISITIAISAITATAASFSGKSGGVTNVDDSCDIAVTPAATLLLPYFEVDVTSPPAKAQTTLFTVVNTSRLPQIARVTLWTDLAFPAYSFNVFLTGYGLASINLRDLFLRGSLPSTPIGVFPGDRSASNVANPNHRPDMAERCALTPATIPAESLAELRSIFTTGHTVGTIAGCDSSAPLGFVHLNAIGYATIDVVASCSSLTPNDSAYYTTELLFDNVLTGDYENISPDPDTGNNAGGSPLVHIRAIPEGGPVGSMPETNLPYTFYDRLTAIGPAYPRTIDRRQPLPSTFAVRYIQAPPGFTTSYQIWREGYSGTGATCASYKQNNEIIIRMIRFDENENSFTFRESGINESPYSGPYLPATSSRMLSSSSFPQNSGNANIAGWMYFNISDGGSPAYSVVSGRNMTSGSSNWSNYRRQSQNWVVVTMTAEGRYAATWDAALLGNGCSISPKPEGEVGPGANVTP